MFRQIFVNLPIKDMAHSRAFFEALGLTFNARFTNEQGACLEIGENFYAMLLVEPFFQGFTTKPISNAHQATEVLLARPDAVHPDRGIDGILCGSDQIARGVLEAKKA